MPYFKSQPGWIRPQFSGRFLCFYIRDMKGEEMIIPPLFRCPISLDLFKDPVTLCTGQTYDRSCIEKWLAAGNLTCPVTMQKLPDSSMVPNHTLSHLICDWLHSSTQVESLELTNDHLSIGEIKQIIESDESTLENKIQVLEKVHSLSQELPLKNSCLIKLDFFKLLLELLFKDAKTLHFQESLRVVDKALFCALKLMPFSDLGSLNMLKQESKYAVFLLLLEQGNMFIKKSLCLVLEAISSSPETQNLCEKLANSDKLVQEIVHLIQHKPEANDAGIRALSALSQMETSHENLVREGAVEGLVDYLSNVEIYKGSLAPMAVTTIEKLLHAGSAKDAIRNHTCGVKSIVKMVFRVSNHEGSEGAINLLMTICSDSKTATEKAIADGVLTQLLLLLQSQCSARTKTKARMLLKLLRLMWNQDPNNCFKGI